MKTIITNITIAGLWLAYMDTVLPKDAPPVQIMETKRAFYAGVISTLEVLNGIGKPNVSEERGVEIIAGLNREGRAFVAAVGKSE